MKIPFFGLFHSRDKPQNAVSAAPSFYFGTSSAGKNVNPRNAMQVSAVFACVRVIAETIECKRKGKLTPATVIDHIVPHRGDQRLFWDDKNWQPLCKDFYDRKTGSGL